MSACAVVVLSQRVQCQQDPAHSGNDESSLLAAAHEGGGVGHFLEPFAPVSE